MILWTSYLLYPCVVIYELSIVYMYHSFLHHICLYRKELKLSKDTDSLREIHGDNRLVIVKDVVFLFDCFHREIEE